MEIIFNEVYIKVIDDLKIETDEYEMKISFLNPIMNVYYRRVIKRNNDLIDYYTNLAIEVVLRKEA